MTVADQAGPLGLGAVIYQIYPRSYLDADGDGVGDLAGITAKLAYVAGLGVDAVWLSPFFASPMADFGYDVADYCDVDPVFGTLADFDALLAEAHRLGLKLVIDQVYCHTSDRHPWFQDSRSGPAGAKADWYVWADAKPDGSPPNNWQSVFYGPAWTWDARRSQYYLHNFLPQQPQLNVHRPQVQAALLDVARFWLARGVDGFRLDALNFLMHDPALGYNPAAAPGGSRRKPFDFQAHLHNQSHPDVPVFLERLRAVADAFGGRFLVAEVPGEHALEEMRLYTAGSARLHSAYSFDFLYAGTLSAEAVRAVLSQWPDGWPAYAFSNHDAPRAVSRWVEGRDPQAYAKLLLLLLVCLRGHVFLYQGEELGLPQAEVAYDRLTDPEAKANWPQTLGRDGARTPMPWRTDEAHAGFSGVEPWLPVDPRHARLSVEAQDGDPASTLAFTRRLLAVRRDLPALRGGDLHVLGDDVEMLVFERRLEGVRLLCVFNLGHGDVDTRLTPGVWRVVFATPGTPVGEEPPPRLPPCSGFIARRA